MGASFSSPVFQNNGEFFMDTPNIIDITWPNVSAAATAPVATSSANLFGYDWSQPFPGVSINGGGHSVYLTVAKEVAINETIVQNSTTVLTSLTFSAPESLMSNGFPVPMHDSWHICRHIFISTASEIKSAADSGNGCGALPATCISDLKDSLTASWGTASNTTMCSKLIYDPIPPSCRDTFGFARQDVLDFDNATIANKDLGLLHTSKKQQQYSWRIGTGYHSPRDAAAYSMAADMTYLVATVWGYSQYASPSTWKVPDVSFACLSSGARYIPPPPPPPASSTSTSTSTSVATATPSAIPNYSAYYDDFSQGMTQWTSSDGTFNVDSGALSAASSEGGKSLLQTSYSDFTYEADITFPSANSGDAGVIFRVGSVGSGPYNYQGYYAGFGTSGNIYLGKISNGWTGLGASTAQIQQGTAHHLKVRAIGPALDVYVDDMSKPKLSVKDGAYASGMDGVRVFQTAAKFDSIQLLPLQFFDDFSGQNMNFWNIYDGSFDATFGTVIAQPSDGGKALIRDRLFADFSYEADVSITNSGGDAGLIFRASSPQAGVNSYYGYYAGFTNSFVTIGRVDNNWNELARASIAGFDVNKTHRLKVQAKGAMISVFLDDMIVPKLQVKDTTYHTGMNGFRTHQTLALFDNIAIYAM